MTPEDEIRAMLRRRASRATIPDPDELLRHARRGIGVGSIANRGALAGPGTMLLLVLVAAGVLLGIRPTLRSVSPAVATPAPMASAASASPASVASPASTGAAPTLAIVASTDVSGPTSSPIAPSAWQPGAGDPTPRIAAVLADLGIRDDTPGCAVAVSRQGAVVYSAGFGLDGNGVPMTPGTPFMVAGQPTRFTALTILQLAQQGSLAQTVVVRQDGRTIVEEDGSWALPGIASVLIVDPGRSAALAMACAARISEPPPDMASAVLGAWLATSTSAR